MKHQISIIIPTLNEADNIGNLLEYLLKNTSKENIADIIVVDGGSKDDTQNIISKFKKVSFQNSKKGRAKQMNLGAENTTGNILYFLHADSLPPKNFDTDIINQIKNSNQAGCFIMRFNSNHWWLKLAGQLTRLPFKSCRGGDQSLFITKSLFNTIGGFNENFKIYEDNDLIGKLYACKQFVVIQKWLTTSPRRYNTNGIWRLQFHYWAIHLKKWLGASPEKLNQYYLKHVKC
ncbi:TIGR04283 family arsenosugar biosynthesis glycosyltransferase [Sabulilitoribacter arenilitoris]|uniref:TIGR04283 family arsenosugar biosynthesis glycosyltransferase n=1 Tax=Wocania arenilitoris TaxID=2044858 RepID=A0AAE3JKY5_9FLAO|nr:TIGR04283 family arsenosugar biosynthesis glycosyltransferase [Wocania arenilitoris]MCF7567684.1 TIGR04283 family arsenosugar biosynthesis glycosyltransferase [Wocania arenilitoris]